jgi:hypothetical protein
MANPEIHQANRGAAPDLPEFNLMHLPYYGRAIASEFEQLIEMIQRAKEDLIADQDFDRAADVRDIEKKIRKYAARFTDLWPNDAITGQ